MQGKGLFIFAVLVGIYSYSLFIVGILKILSFEIVLLITLLFVFFLLLFLTNYIRLKGAASFIKENLFLSTAFIFAILINLVGTLGPELGFDALWYHLTIPKLFIEKQGISFIEGGLLYYSVMPKLADLLYIPALMFGHEIFAKLIHFAFGILTTIVVYKIANIYVNNKLSFLAALIFYTNLVVGWMSITAYIDLARSFFTSLSILFFILFIKSKDTKYLYFASFVVGLEISTKLLGVSTLISLVLVLLIFIKEISFKERIKKSLQFVIAPVIIVIPWLLFSFYSTGSLFYPFLTKIYPSDINFSSFNPFLIVKNTFNLFMFSTDPISPIYLIILPLLFLLRKKIPQNLKILIFIFLINLLIWNFIPQKNARFILPYLSIASVLVVWVIAKCETKIQKILYLFVFITVFVNILYRGVANSKYLPVIIGYESKEEFLSKNLNFSFGDYIDINNSVSKIVKDEIVLINGIHNLYYINFKFDHESWSGDNEYKYILSRPSLMDDKKYELVYHDSLTNTYLYEKN